MGPDPTITEDSAEWCLDELMETAPFDELGARWEYAWSKLSEFEECFYSFCGSAMMKAMLIKSGVKNACIVV